MTTKLQMMLSPVYSMVVDVMITQNVCAICKMSKVIVFNAITTTQDVLWVSSWDVYQNFMPYMWVINR